MGPHVLAIAKASELPRHLAGYPALSIRDGFTASGPPISSRISGKPFQDNIVMKAGDAFGKATDFRGKRPSLPVG